MFINAKLMYALVIALLLTLAGAGVQSYRLALEQKDHAETIAKNEKEWSKLYASSANAAQDAFNLYDTWVKSLQKEAENAKKQRDKANADAVANADVGNKLRSKLAEARANACTKAENTTTNNGSQAAGTAINMFDYVQRRLDEASDGIAEYADQAAIAGRACERSYDAIAN